jgi:hypothetical protein
MTATEELRRLLDERGVEWGNIRNDGSESDYLTEWEFDGIQSYAVATEWSVGGGLSVEIHQHHLTPEQAIAATLGAGTCHVKAAKKIGDLFGFSLSCGHSMVNPFNDRPDYCPWCGKRIVEEVDR